MRRSARERAARSGRGAIRLEDGVPRDADEGASPVPSRSSGTCATPAAIAWRGSPDRSARPSTRTVPDDDARMPEIVSASSRWPFPATPTIATISPARTRSETWPSASPPRSPCADRPSTERATSSRCGVSRSTRVAVSTSRPTISAVSDRGVTSDRSIVVTVLPPRSTVTRSATAITSWSLCEMKITVLAVGRHRAQCLEELLRLLRREHRSRLVHDQNSGLAVQRLENLDPLLLADGELPDPRARIDAEPVAAAETRRRRSRSSVTGRASTALPGGHQGRCSPRRRTADEPEVLVHHADARVDRVAWCVEMHQLAVQLDLPLVGAVEAREDVRQGRLAGAVLSEQRVHLADARPRNP